MPAVSVHLFGSLGIEVGDQTLGPRDFGGLKPKRLLEILLLERGRPVAKDRLAELLWGNEPPRNVAATLETYVSLLRRRLRAIVCTEPGAYRVAPENVDVDLDRFDALRTRAAAARARAGADERRGARHDLELALSLVRGEVLEDEPYSTWAIRVREVYRERLLRMLVEAAESTLEDNDAIRALELSERAIVLDRTVERGYRAAMTSMCSLGRRDEALATYHRCRGALAAELGVEPSAETDALRDAIRAGTAPTAARPPTPVRAQPIAIVVDVPMLGRSDELAALERATREALAGTARSPVIVVEGEAGIGKSRTVDELVRRIGARHVARAKCIALERQVPFAPIAHALRALPIGDPARFPGLGEIIPELGGPPVGRARALESLVALIHAQAPLILVLDDLQWADPSTLSAIAYLARRCQGTPLAIISALRGEEVDATHPIREIDVALWLSLPPLTRNEMAPLGVEDLHDKTGGNALLAVEYLRAVREGNATSARLHDVVLSRCRSAGPDAHRVLVAASSLGRSFDPDVLAAMLKDDPVIIAEHLEALAERKLLAIAGACFDFRHDLIRETLYETLSPARRRHLHARAVAALEGSSADPATIAHHAEQAGALEHALRASIRAADAARARFANAEAVAHLERAVRIADAGADLLDPAALETLLIKLGRLLTTTGRVDRAEAVVLRARESAEARADDVALFDALEALALARQLGASAPSEALAIGEDALALAKKLGSPTLLARGHALVGSPLGSLGQLDEALAHCKESIACAERASVSPAAEVPARIALTLRLRGNEAEALGWTDRAEAAAREQLAEGPLIMARWVRGMALAALGRYRDALSALDSIAEVGRGEETFWSARVPNTYGAVLADICQYERALERDLESLEVARKLKARPVREAELHSLLNLATDRLALGRHDEARRDIETVRRQVNDVEYARFRWLARMHAIDAELAVIEGAPEHALGAAEACLALATRYKQPKYEIRAQLASSRALRVLGKKTAARRQASAAAVAAEQRSYAGLAWRSWWAAYEASGLSDDRRRAEAAVASAAEGLDNPLRDAFLRSVPVGR
jgi:DNA-binding SARP family transcriptional activator/tetratricopeptide (TPR) repeat protein